jgi:hypothetical protein
MSSLSTYFLVGKDQYVRFEEHFGSKDFVSHVWSTADTPFVDGGESSVRRQTR